MTAALIMAQAQMICESGEKPVLMLDDLSSELDEEHHVRVLRAGLELGVQIWLTGTKLTTSLKTISNDCAMFHVKQGVVTQVKSSQLQTA